MRTYIGPIGYNPTSATRPILSHGLDHGDSVTLIRPKKESDTHRAEQTIGDIERNLGALEPEVSMSVERIPHNDFATAVVCCQKIILRQSGRRILILGGGARDILIPLTIAGIAILDSIDEVLSYSDVDGRVREIQLPNLTASIPEAAESTLDAIEAIEHASLPKITEQVEHSKSTVTRHVSLLDQEDVVETWREGRTKFVRLTATGSLLQHDTNDV